MELGLGLTFRARAEEIGTKGKEKFIIWWQIWLECLLFKSKYLRSARLASLGQLCSY